LNLRKIEHQHTETVELLDPAPESIQCGSADHAPRASDHGHILYAFDLVLKFHTFVHTHQPSKKFRDSGLPDRRKNGAKVTACESKVHEIGIPGPGVTKH
jgi:hypothetical protein